MKVLVVEPMKKCYTKEINGLEEMQALVGGYIPGKVSEKFDRKRRFSDIDALFRQEDACNEAAGKAA